MANRLRIVRRVLGTKLQLKLNGQSVAGRSVIGYAERARDAVRILDRRGVLLRAGVLARTPAATSGPTSGKRQHFAWEYKRGGKTSGIVLLALNRWLLRSAPGVSRKGGMTVAAN